jgi:methyltransferase-like protein/SAM-dependent methyltransferase
MASSPTSYDDLPYPSYPYAFTHPDRLSTVATLLGMSPAPADRCRVLELGCASGGNLIPLAHAYPDSTFVGVDLSPAQVREGQQVIDRLGLPNVGLLPASILEVNDGWGLFDYVICHGVYSWVPAQVQDKILEICARNLAPEGVALISYNTYPGWHMRGAIRAMMGLHDRRHRDLPPLERVARARALLDFLARSAPAGDSAYARLLGEHVELLKQCTDSYLFHEHLEECNEPVYFIDFCDRLAARGLRYLGESEFGTMVAATSFAPEVRQKLAGLADDLLEMEQYMDLLRNRMFRATLVCHAHVRPRYEVLGEHLAPLRVAAQLHPASQEPDLRSAAEEEFRGPRDLVLATSTPLVKAALACLADAWPRPLPFAELRTLARRRLDDGSPDDPVLARADTQTLRKALLTAYARPGEPLVELSLRPPAFATEAGERPVASALARLQAESNHLVTNLRHERVSLNKLEHQLLPLLDGTRDQPALLAALAGRFREGAFHIIEEDEPVTDAARAEEILAQVLDRQLAWLAKAALLVS